MCKQTPRTQFKCVSHSARLGRRPTHAAAAALLGSRGQSLILGRRQWLETRGHYTLRLNLQGHTPKTQGATWLPYRAGG